MHSWQQEVGDFRLKTLTPGPIHALVCMASFLWWAGSASPPSTFPCRGASPREYMPARVSARVSPGSHPPTPPCRRHPMPGHSSRPVHPCCRHSIPRHTSSCSPSLGNQDQCRLRRPEQQAPRNLRPLLAPALVVNPPFVPGTHVHTSQSPQSLHDCIVIASLLPKDMWLTNPYFTWPWPYNRMSGAGYSNVPISSYQMLPFCGTGESGRASMHSI